MKVKICGIKEKEHVALLEELNVDYVGFVFCDSKRKVTIEKAKEISCDYKNIKKVGVFQNNSKEFILKAYNEVGLDFVQLHGNEPVEFVESLQIPVIKAFNLKDKDSINKMTQYKNINNLVGYLVDGAKGGSGEVFQWNWIKELSDDIREKLFLAGGINEENLEKAMQEVKPEVVDLSSYLEVNGVKSSQKIKRFMNKVKELKERGY